MFYIILVKDFFYHMFHFNLKFRVAVIELFISRNGDVEEDRELLRSLKVKYSVFFRLVDLLDRGLLEGASALSYVWFLDVDFTAASSSAGVPGTKSGGPSGMAPVFGLFFLLTTACSES